MGWPGPLTHRQFEAWAYWVVLDANMPRRSDAYAMQTAVEVRRVLRKDPASVKMKHFVLKFPEPNAPVSTIEQRQKVMTVSLLALQRTLARNKGMPRDRMLAIVDAERRRMQEELDGERDRAGGDGGEADG